ncbi:enoyl-CoA hydratase/isomerase family protein [Clostridium estertheticum]|uniref:polyketide synthase n=1 Tax=Clostridium estertheticum TaxID=238834 RepID=UPI001CCD5166|nr:polyketide synthase [Clostridium estertheticum]MBZ9609903.1 enoyl-CoA hydratase/isomerase family protein [Clostridium estertheticum]
MTPKEILLALQTGKISAEECEKELAKIRNILQRQFAVLDKPELGDKQKSFLSPNPLINNKFVEKKGKTEPQPIISLREIEPGIVQLTMHDCANKNAFSEELSLELIRAFETIQKSSQYKVVILTGYGNYFACGGTKEGLLAIYNGNAKYTDTNLYRVALDCEIPVIAAMQGHAIGAGWCLGMSCDFVMISRESYYTTNFMKLGFTPGFGATLIFPEKLGAGLAQEILFTGKRYQGTELESRGVSFPVLPSKEVLPNAIQLAKTLAESPRESLIQLKSNLTETIREKLADAIEKEIKMQEKTFVNQPEVKERIQTLFQQMDTNNVEIQKLHPLPSSKIIDYREEKQTEKNTPFEQVSQDKNDIVINSEGNHENDIAIIGMSGQFPKSKNLSEFWENLADGRDCISEIPSQRWNIEQYYDPDPNTPGKTYCKWMGVLEDIDKFDPLFFNISPRTAELMDPHERIFLKTVWNLFESTGYTRETLQKLYHSRVGVYVGSMYQHYTLLDSDIAKQSLVSIFTNSSIANRVSYFFNFQGPSIVVDTACASSAVAVHMACESLVKGDCEIAVVGGVNLSIHPKKYVGLSLAKMCGSKLNSRSFANGDGFIPSEGVGAVLLKPLSKAIHDNDSILAIIKSTAINHGGHSKGLSVPNPEAQAKLFEYNFKKSGIDPRTVSYVECAANGSILGDANEIVALNKIFQKFTPDRQFCIVGSVKSNIGHAEAASGISQLIKVVLQLQHKQIVPTIMAEQLNPNICFNDTPFHLQKELCEWKTPVAMLNGEKCILPLRAAINSFGAGTNVHIIIEEYICHQNHTISNVTTVPQIVVFSAKSQERVQIIVLRMLEFIETQEEFSLNNFVYTLQIGREEMKSRIAIVIRNKEELIKEMRKFLESCKQGKKIENSASFYIGDLKNEELELHKLIESKLMILLTKSRYDKIAYYWTQGFKIDWNLLHVDDGAYIIDLPNYPFSEKSYWLKPQLMENIHDFQEVAENKIFFKEWVISIISDILKIEPSKLNVEESLDQYGFDSIFLMQLFQQLQVNVDSSIDISKLQKCRTIQDIINIFPQYFLKKNKLSEKEIIGFNPINLYQFPELINLNGQQQGHPVFWIHPGVGGVDIYSKIASRSKKPFYGIQPRGWTTERNPLHGIEAMAAYYVHIILSIQPQGYYDLGGYSLGGVLAYEVTRQLQELGKHVNSLVMVDSIYNSEVKRIKSSRKSIFLQAINMMLSTAFSKSSPTSTPNYISSEEINLTAKDEDFLVQLILLARSRGLEKNEDQIQTQLHRIVKIQSAYSLTNYIVSPLTNPKELTCYYFRNKRGLFFGELEPYYTIPSDEILLDHTNYWSEWEKNIPDFRIIDLDSSNHMVMLSEFNSYEKLLKLCEQLYFNN